MRTVDEIVDAEDLAAEQQGALDVKMAACLNDMLIIPPADAPPVIALFGDAMTQLNIVVDELAVYPWATPGKVQKAFEACLEERVLPTDTGDTYAVVSAQQAEGTYQATIHGTCTCQYARTHPSEHYGCYHPVAAKLYQRWQQNQRSLIAPAPQKTPPIAVEAPTMAQASRSPKWLPDRLSVCPRSITAIVADLSKPLPEGCVATKPSRMRQRDGSWREGAPVAFLHWYTVAAVLDTYAPGWKGELRAIAHTDDRCEVTYRLTIPSLEGDTWQEDAGCEDDDKEAYGDSLTNAVQQAFKRAASKFGVGRSLYEKDQTAAALRLHLKTECIAALAELGKAVDTAGLDRDATITWLKAQTGAVSNATIPLLAIRALTTHLGG